MISQTAALPAETLIESPEDCEEDEHKRMPFLTDEEKRKDYSCFESRLVKQDINTDQCHRVVLLEHSVYNWLSSANATSKANFAKQARYKSSSRYQSTNYSQACNHWNNNDVRSTCCSPNCLRGWSEKTEVSFVDALCRGRNRWRHKFWSAYLGYCS